MLNLPIEEEMIVIDALRNYRDLTASVYEKYKGNADKPAGPADPCLKTEVKAEDKETDTPVKRKFKKRKYKKREPEPASVDKQDADYKAGVEKLKKENTKRVQATSLLASAKFQCENIQKKIDGGALNEVDLKSAKRRRHYLAGKVEKLEKRVGKGSDN